MPDTQALQLIQDLLTCPSGEEPALLQANPDLLDNTFVQLLETVAQQLAEQSPEAADFLRRLAAQLAGDNTDNSVIPAQDPQADLRKILGTIIQTQGDPQAVYALLQQQVLTSAHLPALERLWQDMLANLSALESFRSDTLKQVLLKQYRRLAILFNIFGNLITDFQLGNRALNLELGIQTYQLVLQVFTYEALPQDWAATQNNLGEAYRYRIVGSHAENLEQAIKCYANALQVCTREVLPQEWAQVQNNLGIAYSNRIAGSYAENLEQAIECYKNALQVHTREALPQDWARVQSNLGLAYSNRIAGNHAENLEQAIKCYANALQVCTREVLPQPQLWAITQNNLGIAYSNRIAGSRAENLEQAIKCYKNALQVYTHEALPQDWARTQNNLGNAYRQRISGSYAENLEQAIQCYANALQVRSREALPQDWADTQSCLGNAYFKRIIGSRTENLEQAIECFANTLQIYTHEALPRDWAATQNDLGNAYSQRIVGSRAENLEQAIECYANALQVYSRDTLPRDWAMVQHNLGEAYRQRIAGSRAENLEQAIQCFEKALQVRSCEALPQHWARTQNNLGIAYFDRIVGNRTESLEQAIQCFENALQVRNRNALPQECMETLNNRGLVQLDAQDWRGAWDSFSEAMSIIEDLRADIQASEEAKLKLADMSHKTYRGGIHASLGLGEVQDALLTLERGKTRWLGEQIAYRGDLPMETRQQLQNLRQQVAQEQAKTQPNIDKLSILRQQYNDLDPLPRLDAERLAALAQGRLLLLWHLDEANKFFQVFAQSDQTLHHWRPEKQDWDSLVDAVKAYLQDYYQDSKHWQQNLDQHLHALANALCWDELFDWITQHFPAVKELVLIPHRWLHLLPLHALPCSNAEHENKSDCLLDHYTVRYAPSLQILWQIQQRNQANTMPQCWFAVQNPTQDLKFADIEVKALAGLFPDSAPSDVLAHQAATLEAVQKHPALTTAPVLHFSCHGGFDLSDVMQSALLLAGDERLDLQTIFAQQLPHAHLVTLSACETGMTDFQFEGDEYIGLSSGFLSAGARHVVSSLWSVSDISTMLLLLRFYHQWLKAGDPDIAPALNAAQRWLRQATVQELREWSEPLLSAANYHEVRKALAWFAADDKPYQSPFHWAAFCAVG